MLHNRFSICWCAASTRPDEQWELPEFSALLSARVRKLVSNNLPHLFGCNGLLSGA
jgi:hypothetical protein